MKLKVKTPDSYKIRLAFMKGAYRLFIQVLKLGVSLSGSVYDRLKKAHSNALDRLVFLNGGIL